MGQQKYREAERYFGRAREAAPLAARAAQAIETSVIAKVRGFPAKG